MAVASSNPQLPTNSLLANGKLANRIASASAARHHWRAREGHASSGGGTSSSCCGAGMISRYPFAIRQARSLLQYRRLFGQRWAGRVEAFGNTPVKLSGG